MVRFIASARPSHGAWNTGSFASGSTGPKPCMPPMSWTPFMSPALASSAGVSASPVPIMELRVTSAASLSSLQPSAPAGRIGTTMKRVSAVESHTRISVSAGSVTPKSASTPRGSITARER